MAGGAGYVISRLAVSMVINDGPNFPSMCRQDGGYEDVEIGRYVTALMYCNLTSISTAVRRTFMNIFIHQSKHR